MESYVPAPPPGPIANLISLGVLANYVSRDTVDDAVEEAGKAAQRSDVKLTPSFVVYFVMALALFAHDDYEEVAQRMAGCLAGWGVGFDPTSGGLTKARQRLGARPLQLLFSKVARPVAEEETAGAFFGRWRAVSIDGLIFDAEASKINVEEFGLPGSVEGRAGVTQVRAVTICECASHAPLRAALGPAGSGKGTGERTLARPLLFQLDPDWILLADRGFYSFADWCTADDTGAALLWRVGADLRLPVLREFADGSYESVLIDPKARGKAREALLAAARAGEPLDRARARYVRVVEYDVPDREGTGSHELFALITNILDPADADARALAGLYVWRWEHE
ncbi:IS4 family transposase, partial [Frankia sp. CiP3]|uniref:IS4 family transposase n=1 Tax=Frankia sp. CiP3 TaxID=2880971 RepID=UPI001EF66222